MVVMSDENRKQQLLCSLACSDHPTRKFAWGNLTTLRDNIADDDLYRAVHEFRKRHYSAQRMTLAVQVLSTSISLLPLSHLCTEQM
jgi:nardilysin